MTQGFSLYDTKDEEGLHAGNSDMCSCCGDCNEYEFEYEGNEYDYDQDDYDLEEITRDNDDDGKGYSRGFSYTIPPTHHIEVELNTVPNVTFMAVKVIVIVLYLMLASNVGMAVLIAEQMERKEYEGGIMVKMKVMVRLVNLCLNMIILGN